MPSANTPLDPILTWSNQHIWLDGIDLRTEHKQAHEEGRDLASVEEEFKTLSAIPAPDPKSSHRRGGQRDLAWCHAAAQLIDKVQTLPLRPNFPYVEPSDLPAIQAARPKSPKLKPWKASKATFLEHLHGGLLGRICGCMLGKPVEGWSRRDIRLSAEVTRNFPLTHYLTVPTAAQTKKILAHSPAPRHYLDHKSAWKSALLPTMSGMIEDDDTNYTTTAFVILKNCGKNFTPLDVAHHWGNLIPIFHTCTAERVAYRNFIQFILPPRSATHRNPYREWIGAQIRADYFGYANPGDPARAAEWAWRDASVSHIKNGIYGEMWVAAMLAAAFVEKDIHAILRAGLAQIPAQSRLAEDVEKIIAAFDADKSYEQVVEGIHAQWDESHPHDWCHTNSNAQIVAAALLFGQGDYEKTITLAVAAAFDTDCNAATAGSIWGIIHGVNTLPKKWTKPIKNQLRTGVDGYHDVKISALAQEMADVALRERPAK